MNFTKIAKQFIPKHDVGRSPEEIAARSLRSAAPEDLDETIKKVVDGYAKAPDKGRKLAIVATKLLSSRQALKAGKNPDAGNKLIAQMKDQGVEMGAALAGAQSHYKNKNTFRKFMIAGVGASALSTIIGFAAGGAAGLVPLVALGLTSVGLAKSRKAGHRLEKLADLEKEHAPAKAADAPEADAAKAEPVDVKIAASEPEVEHVDADL